MAKKSKKQNKRKRPSLLRRLVKWGVVLALWGILIVAGILAWFAKDLPNLIDNPRFERKASITVMADDGSVLARYGDFKEGNVSADDLPKNLSDAIISIEDRRFYYHFGLDPIGLARAIYVNLAHESVRQGGSTITQQLAKNLFLSQEKTYKRKIQEALLALWLEHELTKKEILAAYMNRVYLGSGSYGVTAASKIYFNKKPDELNLKEAAIIAGLLKAPSKYSPLANPEAANKRARTVLGSMKQYGYITQKQMTAANTLPIKHIVENNDDPSARYFTDWIVDQINDIIGTPTTDLVVKTTLDPEVQESTAKILKKYVEQNSEKSNVSQAAAMVLRPDGSIIAMVGGVDYNQSQFNRATQSSRQPGSSFKPIVYMAAIEQGATEETIVDDSRLTEGKYRPSNFGNEHFGEVSLLQALTYSLNTVAVKLAKAVGIENVIGVARRMGITADLEPNLSLALGSSGVPMIQMAGAYATIANGGYAVKPYGIVEVTEKETGNVIIEPFNERAPRVFSSENVRTLVNMMISVVQNGTGQGAKGPYFAAGKTGTSQDHRDAWFDGFSQNYIATVWFGNDDNSPMKRVTGGSLPARAWRDIITAARADRSPSKYTLRKEDGGRTGGFSDMLNNLLSTSPSFPDLTGENANGDIITHNPPTQTRHQRPSAQQPKNGTIGYGRLND